MERSSAAPSVGRSALVSPAVHSQPATTPARWSSGLPPTSASPAAVSDGSGVATLSDRSATPLSPASPPDVPAPHPATPEISRRTSTAAAPPLRSAADTGGAAHTPDAGMLRRSVRAPASRRRAPSPFSALAIVLLCAMSRPVCTLALPCRNHAAAPGEHIVAHTLLLVPSGDKQQRH